MNLTPEKEKKYFKDLMKFLDKEYANYTIYPPRKEIFNAIRYTKDVPIKVVILGKEPYCNKNQSNGLAFSANDGERIPPSLVNIFKEMNNPSQSGNLEYLAKQGVLLLNTVLTVREGKLNSHKGKGWAIFTNKVIEEVNNQETPVVFLLWGRYAQRKASLITNPIHYILKTTHPSPLSAQSGFLGCNHFNKTNDFLVSTGQTPINWTNKN
ncbi:uracil-DNA glycosylase [Epulopiscium sp. SCG-B10WGA-EpuloA2]|nr:uracil-DNA glycosylase [Epulopiscium sp. SCG-B10WGA-EpuloA2]